MQLLSSAFKDNEFIPEKYTCEGSGVNPPLSIQSVPRNSKSLALTMIDPDAPVKPWTHWLLYNIPVQTNEIHEGTTPINALAGMGDFGDLSYGGPCPPSGTHRYVFTVYALDTTLDLQEGAKKEEILHAMQGHIIEQITLTGLYKREHPLKSQHV